MQQYVDDNATGNVETIDLVRAIERATGRNVREFFAQWIDRGGHPELAIRATWDGERSALTVEIEQKQSIDDEHPPYAFDLDLGLVALLPAAIARDAGDGTMAGEQRLRVHVERAHESFVIPAQAKPALIRIDPGAYLLCTMTYALGTEWNANALRGRARARSRAFARRARSVKTMRAPRRPRSRPRCATNRSGASRSRSPRCSGSVRSDFARAALLAALEHPHPKVRRAVADALGRVPRCGRCDARC